MQDPTLALPRIHQDVLFVGPRFAVSFERTLRIPDDGKVYPLPPTFGRIPLYRAVDFWDRLPAQRMEQTDFFFPLYQREAFWLGFNAPVWKPNAIQIGVDGINVLSGGPSNEPPSATAQNYLVVPDQPWLDGVKTDQDEVRQFIAVPLGRGVTIGEQVLGGLVVQGIEFRVYEPREGIFPDQEPDRGAEHASRAELLSADALPLGVGAGGLIKQRVICDPYGYNTWEFSNPKAAKVHIVNSEQFCQIAGVDPPPTTITAQIYIENGYPWFELYEERPGMDASDILARVKSYQDNDTAGDSATRNAEHTDKFPTETRKISRSTHCCPVNREVKALKARDSGGLE